MFIFYINKKKTSLSYRFTSRIIYIKLEFLFSNEMNFSYMLDNLELIFLLKPKDLKHI